MYVSRTLLVTGAAATLACLPLSVLLAVYGVDQGHDTDLLTGVIFFLAGAFAVLRRPHHLAARRLLAVGVTLTTYIALGRALSVAAIQHGVASWFWLGNAVDQGLEVAIFCALLALFAVFPDGAYQGAYERRIVRASWTLVPILLLVSRPSLHINTNTVFVHQKIPSPLYVPSLAGLGPLALSLSEVPALLVLLAVALLALRYRRFGREQRLQATWPLLASLCFGLALIPAVLSNYGVVPEIVAVVLFDVTILLLPVALVVGLLRHRLFDIEVVLRKSLVYGALWLLITLCYAGLAAALGIAAGERLPLGVAVLCTLVATLIFQPARMRLERIADRWVFGERLGGYELLARFGASLEGTFDLEDLIPRVAATVRKGLGVEWVRILLWQGPDEDSPLKPMGTSGIGLHDPVQPAAVAPLVHAGERIGAIECGPKEEGEFDAGDQKLLATLGRQAALAIRNAHLTTELSDRLEEIQTQARELTASRARIVQAGEEERRRIERNIHDGVQQELVALMTKIRLARNQLARDPALAENTLAELQEEARLALEDLRELAREIHPSVLRRSRAPGGDRGAGG